VKVGVKLARLHGVMRGMRVMAGRHMRVMAGILDIVVAMMRGCLAMVLRGLLVMLGGLLVVFDNFVFRHRSASSLAPGLTSGQCLRVRSAALHPNDVLMTPA